MSHPDFVGLGRLSEGIQRGELDAGTPVSLPDRICISNQWREVFAEHHGKGIPGEIREFEEEPFGRRRR
jgi:hypothetical protein